MSQPEPKTYLPSTASDHVLGVAECAYNAHSAMEQNNPRLAVVEIDKAIVIAHEARKLLLGKTTPPAAAETQPELLDGKEKNE